MGDRSDQSSCRILIICTFGNLTLAFSEIVVVPKAAVQMRGEPRYHKIVGRAPEAV
jgi:hypothetical protein